MKSVNRSMLFSVMFLSLIMLQVTSIYAKGPLPEPSPDVPRSDLIGESGLVPYEVVYSPEWAAWRVKQGQGSSYKKDPHVWVYTTEFAKRFGMPMKWVDDDLKGAQALAYRVDNHYYGIKCGYFGEIENCGPSSACMLDMYISDEANIPWNSESLHESFYGYVSMQFLKDQYKNDRPEYLKRWKKINERNYPMGFDLAGVVNNDGSLGNYRVVEYDRQINKGLDYISGTMSCGFPDLVKHGGTKVQIDEGYTNKIAHEVLIPQSFMKRVKAYSEEVYEPNSLWSQMKEKMKSKREIKLDKKD
ncbi:MAG: hypothetical protein ACN4GR_07840 [Arenicellales bacterium]